MNIPVYFNDFIKKVIISIDSEKELESLCSKMNETLKIQTIKDIKISVFNLTINPLIKEYHRLRKNSRLTQQTKDERLEYFSKEISKNSFIEYFFETYINLKPIITYNILNQVNLKKEIFNNFLMDKKELSTLFDIADFGEIISIKSNQGDMHDNKSVAEVNFKEIKLIYKPRNLDNDCFFANFVDYLTDLGELNTDFLFPKMLNRNNYAWQQFIEQKECKNDIEAQNFYYRSGVFLSLFYLLSTFDLHYENVIYCGEYPVLIDLETIAKNTGKSSTDFGHHDLSDSVLNTSFIPYINRSGVFDVNLSGLFCEVQESSKIYNYQIVEDDELDIAYKKTAVIINNEAKGVTVNGKSFSKSIALKYLKLGFCDATTILIEKKASIKEFLDVSFDKYDIRARQLLRPTQVYGKFIQSSYHPDILASSEKYEDLFDMFIDKFIPGAHGFLRVQYEVDQMRNGNVPLFYAKLKEKHLYAKEDVLLHNYYDRTISEEVLEKLNYLDYDELEFQLKLIDDSILSTYNSSDLVSLSNLKKDESFSDDEIKEEIYKVVDFLKNKEMIYPDNDKCSSLMIPSLIENKIFLEINDFGLYQGGGIIWFLAAVGEEYNDQELSDFSDRLLNTALYNYKNTKDISVYSGLGGLAYLLANMYQMKKNEFYKDKLLEVLNYISEIFSYKELSNWKCEDFISGTTGLIYMLINVYKQINDNVVLDLIEKIIPKYLSFVEANKLDIIGLAHGISGVSLALSNIYLITKDEVIKDISLKMIEFERNLIKDVKSKIKYTWCRGLSGIALSNYIVNHNLNNAENNAYNEHFIKGCLSEENLCLCHGVYGNIDIIINIIKDNLVINQDLKKKYFTNILEIEYIDNSNLQLETFMLGSTGILYSLLRMKNGKYPSLLSLDIYR